MLFRSDDIHGDLAGAQAFHLAPVPLQCQSLLVETVRGRDAAHLSLDPHDPITPASLDRWRAVARQLDLLFVSDEDVRLPGLAVDPAEALAAFAGGRLRGIALKRSERGGLYIDLAAGGQVEWPGRAVSVVDPTGAGDAFAGGFLAGWLDTSDLATALARGAVSASFALEAWGAGGLFDATRGEAQLRYEAWRVAFIG